MTDTPSASTGRYRLLEELGSGAMARVVHAYDAKLARHIAMKLMHPELAADASCRKHFLHEAQAVAHLSHPNIVTVFDVGITQQQPYIAMELWKGNALSDRIKQDPPKLKDILSIAIQLADALDYAHREGVVHRDLKPGNVLCSPEGWRIKLTDFGIARSRSSDSTPESMAEKLAGTPEYMAPEQILGAHVDGRADLFSLGVMLFQLLTGKLPFIAEDTEEILRKIARERTPLEHHSNERIPPALADIITNLLQKEVSERYQTGAEVKQDLEKVLLQLQADQVEDRLLLSQSFKWRWVAGMVSVVAVTMMLGLLMVYRSHNNALDGLADSYGRSMIDVIASELAEPMLLEDDIALQSLVDNLTAKERVVHLSTYDHTGALHASGGDYSARQFQLPDTAAGIQAQQVTLSENDAVMQLAAPVKYQNKQVGSVLLALKQTELKAAARTSLLSMITLMVFTVATVALAMYFFSRRLSEALQRLVLAMQRVTQGKRNERLVVTRRDEFGRAFQAFNEMTASLPKPENASKKLADLPLNLPQNLPKRLEEQEDTLILE